MFARPLRSLPPANSADLSGSRHLPRRTDAAIAQPPPCNRTQLIPSAVIEYRDYIQLKRVMQNTHSTPAKNATRRERIEKLKESLAMLRRTVIVGGSVAVVGAAAAARLLQSRSGADYQATVQAQRRGLADHPDVAELVRFATLAANSHNTQPWLFRQAE
eukprot:gene26007-28380_t